MKKLSVLLSVLAVAIISLFFESNKKGGRKNKNRQGTVDDEMAGPRGEEIYIGANGGRYFLKEGKKIYVGYKGKKHVSQNE